jgi:hypothetical protein
MRLVFVTMLALGVLAPLHTARPGPMPPARGSGIPPIVEDSGAPQQCTIAYLVTHVLTNDTFLVRMRLTPGDDARPVRNRFACPSPVPARFGIRALDACTVRADDANQCVYSDMARGFEREPIGRNTAENQSRCRSDQWNFIGLACRKSGAIDLCAVGCGNTEPEAIAQARTRCEEKHQASCAITQAAPIAVP